MLEPYDGKLSRTVLRGTRGRKTLWSTRCVRKDFRSKDPGERAVWGGIALLLETRRHGRAN